MAFFSIVFENDEIIIVNKENGVSVQGGVGISHPLDKELALKKGYPVYLVHRLDKDTAGLLLVAKSSASAAKWTSLIGGKTVKKEYSALCIGLPASGKSGRLLDTVFAHGREQSAELFYRVESSFEVEAEGQKIKLSLLKITLGTGRMHQIRIQLAKAGCPIVADDQHGNFRVNKVLRRMGMKKLCLAATRLTIPLEGGQKEFSLPLPNHISQYISAY